MLFGIYAHLNSIRYKIIMRLPQVHNCHTEVSLELQNLLKQFHQMGIPGGQLSFLTADGKAQHCAFGWSFQKLLPTRVKKHHTMRYASLSKVLTAITAFTLIEQEQITLSSPLIELLQLEGPFKDNQTPNITVQHLLSHQAGFDRLLSGDPMMELEPWCPVATNTLEGIKLDFTPGQKMAYSNLGYCLLGQSIAHHSQKTLQHLTEETLLLTEKPSIQPALLGTSYSGEVGYFFSSPDSKASLLQVDYNANLASGGWMGTATELSEVIKDNISILLKFEQIGDNYDYMKTCDKSTWRYCHGLVFYKYDTGYNITHFWRDGSLPGVTGITIITTRGDVLVLLANYRPYNWLKFNDKLGILLSEFVS